MGNTLLWTNSCTVAIWISNFSENRSITKHFIIKTLLEMTVSTTPRLLTQEFIISKSFSIRNFFVMYSANRRLTSFWIFNQTWFFWCCRLFYLSYSASPRFFTLESIISICVLIGKYFVIDRFMWSGIRRWTSLRIFRPNGSFLMSWAILLIMFDFSKVFYTRIYHF